MATKCQQSTLTEAIDFATVYCPDATVYVGFLLHLARSHGTAVQVEPDGAALRDGFGVVWGTDDEVPYLLQCPPINL